MGAYVWQGRRRPRQRAAITGALSKLPPLSPWVFTWVENLDAAIRAGALER